MLLRARLVSSCRFASLANVLAAGEVGKLGLFHVLLIYRLYLDGSLIVEGVNTTTSTVLITGNTYPVKERIKALGGTWNKTAQGWEVPADKAEEARAIVASAGAPAARSFGRRSRYGSSYTRFAGGGESFTNYRGRCEDAPCCGCCS